jgi:hypothetical protein
MKFCEYKFLIIEYFDLPPQIAVNTKWRYIGVWLIYDVVYKLSGETGLNIIWKVRYCVAETQKGYEVTYFGWRTFWKNYKFWDLRFSERCSRMFRYSGMWRRVGGRIVTGVGWYCPHLQGQGVRPWRWGQYHPAKRRELLAHRHGVTSKKTCIVKIIVVCSGNQSETLEEVRYFCRCKLLRIALRHDR